ncbi:divergent PAP2 family protein [Marinicrinis sediminis]|uniref:Divergent PAP2 family protein n=1 Tax=Marinicrinis sediminis TaxID=1652465 RepID=A0ABW5R5N0_9BACL
MLSGALRAAMTAIGSAQLLKIPFEKWQTGHWNPAAAISSGGMPSSHSAGVTALATYVGLKKGIQSVDFALATVFGLIVMYDAMGIRRHAGEIAMEVNQLEKMVEKLAIDHYREYHDQREQQLKEMLGHMPQEVAVGALYGTLVGGLCYASHRLVARCK